MKAIYSNIVCGLFGLIGMSLLPAGAQNVEPDPQAPVCDSTIVENSFPVEPRTALDKAFVGLYYAIGGVFVGGYNAIENAAVGSLFKRKNESAMNAKERITSNVQSLQKEQSRRYNEFREKADKLLEGEWPAL